MRFAFFLQRSNPIVNSDEHVAVFGHLWFPADLAVPRNNDGLFGDSGQVCLRRLDHAFDIAAGGIIDERVMTIPPGVAGAKDLSLNEIGRYVAVSVAGPVVGDRDSGTI